MARDPVRLLARSRFRDLITRPGHAVLAVRWETGGHDDEPFSVLDADLTLTAAGQVPPSARPPGTQVPTGPGSSALARGTRGARL